MTCLDYTKMYMVARAGPLDATTMSYFFSIQLIVVISPTMEDTVFLTIIIIGGIAFLLAFSAMVYSCILQQRELRALRREREAEEEADKIF
ncbi:hypothetical protein CDL15_Pgr012563 [Punica granatum]|uniref:Uncharacterized protein n=1 Tax=Punica granatum TaxID=22663 RepID=A0A218XZ53_PUNGR|nr:hypothetical protein CDL15_Pgr012563 [Punica granatum]PKI50800.1 hypothetical protein CRG98_028795 [Punica granatum]